MNLSSLYPFFEGDKPRVIGHRGAMGEAPENTLVSFQKALDDGASIFELDVQGSSDGEAIIIHDETLDRTTDDQGHVQHRSLKEIKALDAGYWYTPDGGNTYPYRGRGAEIPTLKETLLTLPRSNFIVELKQCSPSIVERVVGVIRELGKENQVLLATEDDTIMDDIRRQLLLPGTGIATGFSFGEVAAFFHWATGKRQGDYTAPGQALQIPRTYQDQTLVSGETVAAAHDIGLELFVWTVNEIEEMRTLLGLGVDGLITDYPARLSALLGRRSR